MSIASGTYYIVSQVSGTAWTFVSGDEGAGLTAWLLSGAPSQQWEVSSISQQYIFKNVEYGTYVSFQDRNVTFTPYTLLYGSQNYFPFILEEYKGGYLIATETSAPNVVNLAGQSLADNTSVIFWPLTFRVGADNSVWYFSSTTNVSSIQSQTSSTSLVSSSTSSPVNYPRNMSSAAAVIAGSVVGGLVVLAALLVLSFFLGRWSRSNFRGITPFKVPVRGSSHTPANQRHPSAPDSPTSSALYAFDHRNPLMSGVHVQLELPASVAVPNTW